MENLIGIVVGFAVLPALGALEYWWIRVVDLKVRGFAAGTIELCKVARVVFPVFVFLIECIRYFGAKARIFVPDEPPRAIELIFMPFWVFAAVWVVMVAARRAGRVAK